jgi:hypothetical protein
MPARRAKPVMRRPRRAPLPSVQPETRSRPLVTTVRWSRGTACESRLRVREVRAPAGEDVARVADRRGRAARGPGGRGSARCSSARRTRAVSGSDCGSGASGAGRGPRRRPRLRGSRTAATSRPLYFAATALSPLRVSSGSSAPSIARALSGHGGRAHSQVSARLPPHRRDAWKPVRCSSKARSSKARIGIRSLIACLPTFSLHA